MTPEFVRRMIIAAPMLFVAVLLILDPAGFVLFMRCLARTLEERLAAFQGRNPWPMPAAHEVTPAVCASVRTAGFALLGLAGLAVYSVI